MEPARTSRRVITIVGEASSASPEWFPSTEQPTRVRNPLRHYTDFSSADGRSDQAPRSLPASPCLPIGPVKQIEGAQKAWELGIAIKLQFLTFSSIEIFSFLPFL